MSESITNSRESKSNQLLPTSTDSYKEVIVERRERILIIKFNRPKVRNALNRRAYYDIIRALNSIRDDASITIVVLTGVGDAFCAGNDLAEAAANISMLRKFSADKHRMDSKRLQINRDINFVLRGLLSAIITCPKIVVALVNGLSIGIGFTLAALCDVVYCTENAYFEAPFTRLGLCPEMASSYLFPRIFGHAKASEILLLGARLTAQEAYAFQFVSRIFNTDEVENIFWPKMLECSVLPIESLKESKRLLMTPIREEILKAFKAEIMTLEKIRLGKVHQEAIEKFLKAHKINKSKL